MQTSVSQGAPVKEKREKGRRMSKGRRGRKMAVLASAALLCAGLAIGGSAGPAAAKKKHSANPLAGSYNGTTDLGTTISFTITKSGAVLGLAPTIPLAGYSPSDLPPPGTQPVCPPSHHGTCYFPCPDIPNATVSAPNLRLTKVAPGFSKGKRFEYEGPGASSPGPVDIAGSPVFGANNRFSGAFKGHVGYGPVQGGITTCGYAVLWQATRIGRK